MPSVTLPDGSHRKFDHPVSVLDVAADIGPGLAKATLAGRVNDVLEDNTAIFAHRAQTFQSVSMLGDVCGREYRLLGQCE